MCINIFFGCFLVEEMKKYIYNNVCEKRKKKKGAEIDLGYCPNCVTIQWKIVS